MEKVRVAFVQFWLKAKEYIAHTARAHTHTHQMWVR